MLRSWRRYLARIKLLIPVALIVAAGCGSGGEMFPLKVGNEWSYTVRNGMSEHVQVVKVAREVPVDGEQGFELVGPTGTSRLAWKGSLLVATVLPNARLNPPLPLLVSSDERAARSWKGRIYYSGKTREADATLRQVRESITLAGKKYDVIKATVTIRMEDEEIELETAYAEGFGPLTQVQRTRSAGEGNDQFDVALEYLGGP